MAKSKMQLLISKINVAGMDQRSVQDAIGNSSIHDFEDGMEYYAALNSGCDCIITEDINDFFFSEIEVLRADEFLRKFL